MLLLEAAKDAREGFPGLAKKKIAQASALEMAWMYRFHPVNTRGEVFYVPTRRPPIRRLTTFRLGRRSGIGLHSQATATAIMKSTPSGRTGQT
jgi:hypothetical protein